MNADADQSSFRPGVSPLRVAGPAHDPGFGAPRRPYIADDLRRSPGNALIVDVALRAFVEHFEQGVAVTDGDARVHFLNRAAKAFIREGLVRLDGGHLRGSTFKDNAALRKIIAQCAASGGDGSARLTSGNDPLLVAACAIAPAACTTVGNAVLLRFGGPTTARLPDKLVLQAQFSLTPTEAALAVEILAGDDLSMIAARRGIKLNTARAHLRSIFEKTETRRQSALMRLLMLCPQPIAAGRSAAS